MFGPVADGDPLVIVNVVVAVSVSGSPLPSGQVPEAPFAECRVLDAVRVALPALPDGLA
jgi:hypothetical protein